MTRESNYWLEDAMRGNLRTCTYLNERTVWLEFYGVFSGKPKDGRRSGRPSPSRAAVQASGQSSCPHLNLDSGYCQTDEARCFYIGANICEGCGRRGNGEFHRFLPIAMGSASELEYHLLLARDLGYLAAGEYEHLNFTVTETQKMLASLIVRVGAERSR